MNSLRLVLLPLALVIAACGPAPSDQTTPAPEQPASSPAATTPMSAPPVASTKYIHASPIRLEKCGKGEAVEITWDLQGAFPGVTGVEVYVGSDDKQKLFSAGGAKGTTKTGPWTKPGTIFRLKNKKTGEEIEQLVIDGPPC